MNVVILDGVMGAGKTLGMTLLVKYFQYKSGCALYSNYGITDSKPFHTFRDFLSVARESSSLIALDESHTDLDARNFNTNSVKFFTHLIFYFRKIRTTVFLATPLIDNLDSRVRGVCNLYCRCSKDKNNFYYDMFDLQSNKFLKRYKINQDMAKQIAAELYETGNMVEPLQFPQERAEYFSFLPELKAITDTYYKELRIKARSVGGGLRPQAEAHGNGLLVAV